MSRTDHQVTPCHRSSTLRVRCGDSNTVRGSITLFGRHRVAAQPHCVAGEGVGGGLRTMGWTTRAWTRLVGAAVAAPILLLGLPARPAEAGPIGTVVGGLGNVLTGVLDNVL